jgi:hypothetical protein
MLKKALNTLTIIRNIFFSPPPPDGRNFLRGGSVDLFWNDPFMSGSRHLNLNFNMYMLIVQKAYYSIQAFVGRQGHREEDTEGWGVVSDLLTTFQSLSGRWGGGVSFFHPYKKFSGHSIIFLDLA